jgi:hypothetical protein
MFQKLLWNPSRCKVIATFLQYSLDHGEDVVLYFVRETEVWGFRNGAGGTACLRLTFGYLDGLFISYR